MYKIIGGDQKEYGPATADEVRQWIAEGRLNGQSLARAEGGAEWRPLGSFAEFAHDLSLQAQRLLAEAVPPPLPEPARAPAAPQADGERTVRVGNCLRRSWGLFTSNPGLLFAATFLVWMIDLISQFLPLGAVLFWVVSGALYGGLYLVFLRRIRGQWPAVSEVFSGFRPGASQLMLAGMITSLLSWIGFCFCVIPWVYLTIAWIFAVPLAADRQVDFWQAMERSRRTVNPVWFQVFALALLAFLPVVLMNVITEIRISAMIYPSMQEAFAGGRPDFARLMQIMPELMQKVAQTNFWLILATKFVLLLNLPFALGALMYAYEDLFSPRPRPA